MISTKGRYALRVMIDLAEQNSAGYIPLNEIATRQQISEKYLEIFFNRDVLGSKKLPQQLPQAAVPGWLSQRPPSEPRADSRFL